MSLLTILSLATTGVLLWFTVACYISYFISHISIDKGSLYLLKLSRKMLSSTVLSCIVFIVSLLWSKL